MDNPTPGPYTPEKLAQAINNRMRRRFLAHLKPIVVDEPRRTPAALRGGLTPREWLATPTEQRVEIADQALREQLFDELVARRGVLIDGEVHGLQPARAA